MTRARSPLHIAHLALLGPLACFGHRSTTAPPDPGPATVPCVRFWTKTGSPYLDGTIRTYVPRGIDDAAGFQAVGEGLDLPLVFAFEMVRVTDVTTGYAVSDHAIRPTGYTRLEYRAALAFTDGRILWTHEGWQEHRSVPHAIHDAARSIRAQLVRDGVFAYEPVRAACTAPPPAGREAPGAVPDTGEASDPAAPASREAADAVLDTGGGPDPAEPAARAAASSPAESETPRHDRWVTDPPTAPHKEPSAPPTKASDDGAEDRTEATPRPTEPAALEPKPWPGPAAASRRGRRPSTGAAEPTVTNG